MFSGTLTTFRAARRSAEKEPNSRKVVICRPASGCKARGRRGIVGWRNCGSERSGFLCFDRHHSRRRASLTFGPRWLWSATGSAQLGWRQRFDLLTMNLNLIKRQQQQQRTYFEFWNFSASISFWLTPARLWAGPELAEIRPEVGRRVAGRARLSCRLLGERIKRGEGRGRSAAGRGPNRI